MKLKARLLESKILVIKHEVALTNKHLKTAAWSRRERTWYIELRSAALAFIRKLKRNKAKKQKKRKVKLREQLT